MLRLIHIKEGLRFFKRSISVRRNGLKKYKGNSKEICKKILDDCYNKKKKYFQVSAGHFNLFYTRDFGWIVKSLLELGYKKEVKNTLEYALGIFEKHGRVRTTINPEGVGFDFPIYAVDSLPYMVYSLACLRDKKLVKRYKGFLEKEIRYFVEAVVDKKTGLVRKDKSFSSMKDYSKRVSSCYDNCMLYLLQKSCDKIGLKSLLKKYNYKKLIVDNFWTGEYFLDDLSGKDYVAGDANVFPFWTGVVDDKEMLRKVIASILRYKLDYSLPLKYTQDKNSNVDFILIELFAKGYERSTIWTHMGLLYLHVLGKSEKKLLLHYLEKYKENIMKYKTFLEVLREDGSPFRMSFYYSDEGMSWCANYLTLLKKTKMKP